MKELAHGAEARLFESDYAGEKVVVKEREAKQYRNPILDQRIRTTRTKTEAGLLQRARSAGVRTPRVLKMDLPNARLVLEFLEGKRMKESFSHESWMAKELGKIVAILHANGIVHGDLTTSNVIVQKKRVCLIDFGLSYYSKDVEDKATDLLGLQKTFTATHPESGREWKELLTAYEKHFAKGKQVVRHMKEIEERARYS